jgi:hypothetical protein
MAGCTRRGSVDATAAPLSRGHTPSYRTRSLTAPRREGTPAGDVGLLERRVGVGAPPDADSGVRRDLWPVLVPARGSLWTRWCFTTTSNMRRYASTVAADGPPHRSLAAASDGVAPRPGPGKTWASISSNARVHAVTLSEPASSSSLMVLGALPDPIGARAPRCAVVVARASQVTLRLHLERFKGYFGLILRAYFCLVYMDPCPRRRFSTACGRWAGA